MRRNKENMNPSKDLSVNRKNASSKSMRPVKGTKRPTKGTKLNIDMHLVCFVNF